MASYKTSKKIAAKKVVAKTIVGRLEELKTLYAALDSARPELIAVYGRRRIGKTYLVKNAFAGSLLFELTGLKDGKSADQLSLFAAALHQTAGSAIQPVIPKTWAEAFGMLAVILRPLLRKKKKVIFFDEFPWLNGRRSGFLQAFDHFWNTWASDQKNLVVVICGSAASWMIENVVHAKGGLHNRLSRTINLKPFNLRDTTAYLEYSGVVTDKYQTLLLYMALGGIPHYLQFAERGKSAGQIINNLCFTENGALKNEFQNLYPSLFDYPDAHISVIRALAKIPKGLTRGQIIKACGLETGGGATKVLFELSESGFISTAIPIQKESKDGIYRLTDEFSLFYLKFMDRRKITTKDMWSQISSTGAYKIWCGMAFEGICIKHADEIKHALGIGAVSAEIGPWRSRGSEDIAGTQIDLVIDRADMTVNLCEMKFYSGEFVIDKSYAAVLQQKIETFRLQTRTRKALFLTFITTFGVKNNEYAQRHVQNELTMDIFF